MERVVVRTRGGWVPGPVSMGRWSGPVTWIAAIWIVAESINIAWPRHLNPQWWLNWGLIIMSVALGAIGLVMSARIYRDRSDAAAGMMGGPVGPVE